MQLERVGPYLWRIPQDVSRGMRVPGLVVADEHLRETIRSDASLEQVANGATLPGIVKAAMAMPDIHQDTGSRWAASSRPTPATVSSAPARSASTSTAVCACSGPRFAPTRSRPAWSRLPMPPPRRSRPASAPAAR